MAQKSSSRPRKSTGGRRGAGAATESVLLWHPAVHTLFNEHLHYFALRFSAYQRAHLDSLKQRLDDAGISGYCAYEVLGEYDVVLRVWLTAGLLSRIDRILNELPSLLSFPYFRTIEQRHWGFAPSPDEASLSTLPNQVEAMREAQGEAKEGRRGRRIKAFEHDGLLLFEPLSDRANVKFYTAITFGRPGAMDRLARDRVRVTLFDLSEEVLAMRRTKSRPIFDMSVYLGEGFADVLIKGKCGTVVQARDFVVERVVPLIEAFMPVTTTFAVCEDKPHEADYVNETSLTTFMTGTPPGWIESWFKNLYKLGGDVSLSQRIKGRLEENEDTILQMDDDFKENVLAKFLESIITKDAGPGVREVLFWFSQVEGRLRETWYPFLRELTELGGKEAESAEFEFRRKLGLSREEKKELALGDWLNLYIAVLKKHRPESPLLKEKVLPAELSDVRNLFAHGRMTNELSTQWERVLELLLWFVPWYERLLITVPEGTNEGRSV